MGLNKRTIKSVPLSNKTVLMRADYNVPINDEGKISDDYRIRSSLPTVNYLINHHAKLVIISHLGRPDGEKKLEFSLRTVASRLSELLGRPVLFLDDCVGEETKRKIAEAPGGSIILLENLRFYPGEEENNREFAKQLAETSGAEYFIQDGFGVVHRAHASTSAITGFMPSVSGLLLEHEYDVITEAMKTPKRPLLALLGGAKVSDKIEVIESLVQVADKIVIGGAMANTFIAHDGYQMGKSKVEPGQDGIIETIWREVIEKVGEEMAHKFLVLPIDLAVGDPITKAVRRVVGLNEVPEDQAVLDIGDRSIDAVAAAIDEAETIIWNGTMGMAEYEPFAHGSARAALELALHPEKTSIVGGGDTTDFVLNWDSRNGESFSHVSTGGGASLELMAGRKLPGIEVLLDA